MDTSFARGSVAQEFLIVVQLVVPALKRLLELPGPGLKTSHPKGEATQDSVLVRSRLVGVSSMVPIYQMKLRFTVLILHTIPYQQGTSNIRKCGLYEVEHYHL